MFRRFVLVALLIPLGLAACGSEGKKLGLSDAAGAAHVAVTISDAGCEPNALTVEEGKVAFDVTNSGSAAVTEFYVLHKDNSIVGEVENVIPGSERTLTLALEPGSYLTKCPFGEPEKGTLKVTKKANP